MITATVNRAGTSPAVATAPVPGVVTSLGWVRSSSGVTLRAARTAIASLPIPPTPPASATFVDNGDGTWTASGSSVVDNGDGTWTATGITDNGDGTWTA